MTYFIKNEERFWILLVIGLFLLGSGQAWGQLALTAPVALTPASPAVNQSTTATFTVQNTGSTSFSVQYFLAGARTPSNANVDFPATAPVTIPPGGTYTYSASRSFATAGTYAVWPAYFDGTNWIELAPAHSSFVVQAASGGGTPGTTLFSDDFNRTTGLGTNWSVSHGSYTTNGSQAVSGTPPINGNWAKLNTALGTNDYSVAADLIVPAGSLYSGVVARGSDPVDLDRNLYAAQISTDGSVNLYRRNDWNWTQLGTTAGGISAGISYNLKLVVSGSSPVHLEVWLNGVQKISLDDAAANRILTGAAGIENYDAGVKYDNFTVRSLQSAPPPPAAAASNHVYVVVLENQPFSSVIGNPSMPNLNNMANTYALATNYFANTHPSIGNYFEMTTGQIITNNDAFISTVSVDNIVRHLIGAGKSWMEYSENLPNVGYTGGDVGGYIEHHNPLSYLSDVRGTAQANNLVPFSQLQSDISAGALPNFGFIVPNNCDNAHDCPLSTADTWLQNNVFLPLLNSPPFQAGGDGLLIVLFDESDGTDTANGGGHVATVLIGPKVKRAYQSVTFYQHQSLLRTINDLLGLTGFVAPSDAATAPGMTEFFQ